MEIHTGDSTTVAPAQTLTDKEYQRMRDASLMIMREIGVDTGGSNIQFAVNPVDGDLVVIEMKPRGSRSSALASKATGFPIAKIASKLAVGYTLDESPHDITRLTLASFEPSIDYVVVKIPRFAFEKFPQTDSVLATQIESGGEVMAIGRTFKEALQKAVRSLEVDRYGFEPHPSLAEGDPGEVVAQIRERLRRPDPERLWHVADGLRVGISVDTIYALTKIDRWFLNQMKDILAVEEQLARGKHPLPAPRLREAKQLGFSDHRLGELLKVQEGEIRRLRIAEGVTAVFKRVDTCAAEFPALTPYLYSTYESKCESQPQARQKVMILGGGPNRIGQGIEFDYCCVHAVQALRDLGYETIMVNCNPETVSTDYDTSDRLYFEPLTLEDVLAICDEEKPIGVIVQFGGQTPLKLAVPLEKRGVKLLGTTADAIDRAEDRGRFDQLLTKLALKRPKSGIAQNPEDAFRVADEIGYPVLVRPSYVL